MSCGRLVLPAETVQPLTRSDRRSHSNREVTETDKAIVSLKTQRRKLTAERARVRCGT